MSALYRILTVPRAPSPSKERAPSERALASGSAMTPMLLTRWSPMERAMASPGSVWLASSQTRAGPPHSSSGGETKPPFFLIRRISAGVSGFWSSVKSLASILSPSFLPMIARLSPALAVHSVTCAARHARVRVKRATLTRAKRAIEAATEACHSSVPPTRAHARETRALLIELRATRRSLPVR
eukprot:3361065-Pleurochrysis_carterae.AAC.2